MPLVLNTIVTNIRKISDENFAGFEGFPADTNETALRWSVAVNDYAKSVIPASISADVARVAFENIFKGILPVPPTGLVVFPLAFTAYAVALGLGMAPLFIAVPPPVPIIIAPVIPIGLGGDSAAVCATALGTIIHLWFKTGTATSAAGGSPIPWS